MVAKFTEAKLIIKRIKEEDSQGRYLALNIKGVYRYSKT